MESSGSRNPGGHKSGEKSNRSSQEPSEKYGSDKERQKRTDPRRNEAALRLSQTKRKEITKESGNKNKKPKGRSPKTSCSDEPTPTPGPSNEEMDINTEDAEAIRYTQEWPDTESEKCEEEEDDVLASQTRKEYRPPPIVLHEEGKLEIIRKESAANNIQLRSCKSMREGIKLFPETAVDFRRLRNLLDGKKV
ncbi:hypothetical protein Trydic_g622 [Trypoxylus dichotomus]